MGSNFTLSSSVAILTKHDKQTLLAPLFERAFNSELIHTDKFDTDSLGTFDNKIARKLSAMQSALKKAYLACELTGCSQGIGSEGSFNSVFPIGTLNEEFIGFVDLERKLEVLAKASQLSPLGLVNAGSAAELSAKLRRYSPNQKWMLKDGDDYIKGLSIAEVDAWVNEYAQTKYEVEPDFRAMHCPERQLVIVKAGEDLITRLSSLCPQCGQVDFVADIPVKGRLCELCHLPTEQVKHYEAKCRACDYSEISREEAEPASSFNCGFCNP